MCVSWVIRMGQYIDGRQRFKAREVWDEDGMQQEYIEVL